MATEPKTADWKALVVENQNLIGVVVKLFLRHERGERWADLKGVAMIGLVKAARSYSPGKVGTKTGQPAKFSTFAFMVMRQGVHRHMTGKRRITTVNWDDETLPFETLKAAHDDHSHLECKMDILPILTHPVLTDRESEVLRLHYLEGWTYKMIGDAYGVSITAVDQSRRAGIRKLRKVMAPDWGTYS